MFILNTRSHIYHDSDHLEERCNTDAIPHNRKHRGVPRPLSSDARECTRCCKRSGMHRTQVMEIVSGEQTVCLYCKKP